MADKGDVNLKYLSASTDGLPILITGTSAAAPTMVDEAPANTSESNMTTLLLCNTDEALTLMAGVVLYTGTPADPANVIVKLDLPPKSGLWVVVEGIAYGNGKKLGVWCPTTSKITAVGKVGRATL